MTASEFYNEFNVLYNNVMSNAAPPLNMYDVSVFLTQAAEELVLTYYRGRPNELLSFDLNEESKQALDNLVKAYSQLTPAVTETYNSYTVSRFNKPDDLFFLLQETVGFNSELPCYINKRAIVKPVALDDLNMFLDNPFKQPNNKKVFRTTFGNGIDGIFLISSQPLKSYRAQYLQKPLPIILGDLSEYGVSIDGEYLPRNPVCNLPELLHRTIIKRAVELAKVAYLGDLGTAIAINNRVQ